MGVFGHRPYTACVVVALSHNVAGFHLGRTGRRLPVVWGCGPHGATGIGVGARSENLATSKTGGTRVAGGWDGGREWAARAGEVAVVVAAV